MKVSETYPNLCFVYENVNHQRYHAVRFNQEIDDFIVKTVSENTALFTMESLRLAFSRITSD